MTPAAWKARTRDDILASALRIARELVNQGLTPTLRQLYYQMVAADLCPNGQRAYKRIGATLTAARLAGDFPLDWILDRTRSPEATKTDLYNNVDASMSAAIKTLASAPTRYLWHHRWLGQPRIASVWVEKEALAGVFERPCSALGVGLFTCRGYPSISSLADWLKAQDEAVDETTREVRILYFGDHDPDGLRIPESALSTLRELAEVMDLDHLFKDVRVTLERVALTRAQIAEVNAPPFPAKMSSNRYQWYVDTTGTDDAWELDALPPRYLDRLIRRAVEQHFDQAIHRRWRRHIEQRRDDMTHQMTAPEFLERLAAALAQE